MVSTPLYDRDLLRLAADIPHLGPLADAQGWAERRSPTCGSLVRVGVTLDDAGRVATLGQEVRACALGQAAAAVMGAYAPGRTPAELMHAHDALAAFLAGRAEDPGDWPGVAMLARARGYPARHGAALLAFAAVSAAAAQAAAAVRP